jgi:hypothetical protein
MTTNNEVPSTAGHNERLGDYCNCHDCKPATGAASTETAEQIALRFWPEDITTIPVCVGRYTGTKTIDRNEDARKKCVAAITEATAKLQVTLDDAQRQRDFEWSERKRLQAEVAALKTKAAEHTRWVLLNAVNKFQLAAAKQQIEGLRKDATKLIDRIMVSSSWKRTGEMLQELQALLSAPVAESVVTGDMFWDDYDPEKCEDDPDEILNDNYCQGMIAHFWQATRGPDFYGFFLDAGDGETETDNQFYYFFTKEEAKKELASLTTVTPPQPDCLCRHATPNWDGTHDSSCPESPEYKYKE